MPGSNPNGGRQTVFLFIMGTGLLLVALAVFLALPSAQLQVRQSNIIAVPAVVNYPAPDIQLTDLDGRRVAFSDYRGKVLLYNAWATWCPPCKEEMPTLQAFYDAHQSAGFVVVAVEDGEPANEVAAFVRDFHLTFPVWPDRNWVASTRFKANNLPTSFVIDRKGIVRLTWTGAINREMLEKYVTPLINEQ